MFVVGKTYQFRMIEDGGEVTFAGEIEKYDHPLIKLADLQPSEMVGSGVIPGQIINVTSSNFVSAILKD